MKEELLKKIKVLADKGIGGEKENAQKLLKELMLKYNIKEEDIEEEEIKEFDIKLPQLYNAESLASQVFYSIIGTKEKEGKGLFVYRYKGKKKYYVKCTSAEFLEYEAKFDFFSYHFKKELKIFYTAFVQANGIFPPPEKCKEDKGNRKLTEEDRKALMLSSNLERHNYLLQIEGGKQ